MKTKILSIIALAIGLFSCSDDTWEPTTNNEGELRLSDLSVEVNTAENARSRAEGDATVDVSDFIVTIMQADEQKRIWKYSEMPEIITLPAGDYTIFVKSHEVQKAEFGKPYYLGSKDFSIKAKNITSIGTILCKFASVKVTISIADDLFENLSDDYKVTVKANDTGVLVFTPKEIKTTDNEGVAGYFEAVDGSVTLVATFEGTIKGKRETYQKTYSDVDAGTYYNITYSVKNNFVTPDANGEAYFQGVTMETEHKDVNTDMVIKLTEEVIESPNKRPGQEGDLPTFDNETGEDNPNTPDQPGDNDAITITSKTLNFDGINDPSNNNIQKSAIVNIHSDNGLTNLLVHIESTSEDFVASAGEMVPFDFDLANPVVNGTDWSDLLGADGLQFPVKDQVVGETDIEFNITQFIPLLAGFPGTHKFTITAKDGEAKTSKTLTFIAK